MLRLSEVDAAAGDLGDARTLVFEYMAATVAETSGRAAPASEHGITTLLLDVMRSRTQVIEFYRRLGYTPAEPFPTTSPVPMVFMRRSVGPGDIRIS